jgi:hypothetical protein
MENQQTQDRRENSGKQNVYPEGIICFPKLEKQPDFVKGTIVISPNLLFEWLKKNPELLTEFKGEKQIRLQLKDGKNGLYVTVDNFKPTPKATEEKSPF